MFDKFTYQNLIITLIPGGFLVSVLFLSLPHAFPNFTASLPDQDFLVTFMAIAISLAAGEVIQTLAHSMEWLIDLVFFKGYRPSEVFLLPNNPILPERQREKVLDQNIIRADRDPLVDYSNVSVIGRMCCGKASFAAQSQQVFRKNYTKLAENGRVQDANARYLYARGMFVVLVLVAGWFWFLDYLGAKPIGVWHLLALIPTLLALLFLYRARGCGKGLVCEVAYLSTQ